MVEWIDETAQHTGTEFNRSNMMALQGYQNETVVFGTNAITKTNKDGYTETTTFGTDTITKTFAGEKTITQTITFTSNGYRKVVS